jgi:hypothetical protein
MRAPTLALCSALGFSLLVTSGTAAETGGIDAGQEPARSGPSLAAADGMADVAAETTGREPSALAQLALELLNHCRADPTAEAARYGIDLNEGLNPGTLPEGPVNRWPSSPSSSKRLISMPCGNWRMTSSNTAVRVAPTPASG